VSVDDDYRRTLRQLLERLSLPAEELSDNLGLRIDGDIVVNLERFSARSGEQLVMTCKVADMSEFDTYEDLCRYVATGNYYWTQAHGLTLSTHESTRAAYAQHALPLALLLDGVGVTDAGCNEFEQALRNLVDFVKSIRNQGH